jgi:hypothetical protein
MDIAAGRVASPGFNPTVTSGQPNPFAIPQAGDLFQRRQQIADRSARLWKGGLHKVPWVYIKNLMADLRASLDLRPLKGSTPQQIKDTLGKEFAHLKTPKGGLFSLGFDMLFTAVPNTWAKLKTGDVLGAVGELGKGAVLSAGGLAATAAAAALLPGVGIPGFLLSNAAYEVGKRTTSFITGLKQNNGSSQTAPFIDPSKFPSAASLAQQGADPGAVAHSGSVSGPVSWQSLPPDSQKALADAMRQVGGNASQLTG